VTRHPRIQPPLPEGDGSRTGKYLAHSTGGRHTVSCRGLTRHVHAPAEPDSPVHVGLTTGAGCICGRSAGGGGEFGSQRRSQDDSTGQWRTRRGATRHRPMKRTQWHEAHRLTWGSCLLRDRLVSWGGRNTTAPTLTLSGWNCATPLQVTGPCRRESDGDGSKPPSPSFLHNTASRKWDSPAAPAVGCCSTVMSGCRLGGVGVSGLASSRNDVAKPTPTSSTCSRSTAPGCHLMATWRCHVCKALRRYAEGALKLHAEAARAHMH
jgi:hypothetical protein